MASARKPTRGPIEHIARSIRILRGQKILLDAELATLHGVTTRRLIEQVRRNRKRFPDDFLFELAAEEFASLKSHFATSSWVGRRKLPYEAIQALMSDPAPRQGAIGFTADLEQQ